MLRKKSKNIQNIIFNCRKNSSINRSCVIVVRINFNCKKMTFIRKKINILNAYDTSDHLTLVVTALNELILTWKSFEHQTIKSGVVVAQLITCPDFVVDSIATDRSFSAIIEKALGSNGEIFFFVGPSICVCPKSFKKVLIKYES